MKNSNVIISSQFTGCGLQICLGRPLMWWPSALFGVTSHESLCKTGLKAQDHKRHRVFDMIDVFANMHSGSISRILRRRRKKSNVFLKKQKQKHNYQVKEPTHYYVHVFITFWTVPLQYAKYPALHI